MASPKYCSWDVKELASDYGWTELPTHPNDEGRMLSFYSSEHGGVRANVFMKTGTVATSLDHPTQGKTQLFRGQRDTFEKLEEIFDNPRTHTDSGYKTRAKLREEEDGGSSETVLDVVADGEDDIEQFRGESSESDSISIFAENEVMADLCREGRYDEEDEFDGESLMEKLMNKWDEEEENESDEIVLSGIQETLDLLNDEEYHRSISEVDFSEVSSSSDGSESVGESEEISDESDEAEDAQESEGSLNDSDQQGLDETNEGRGESEEACSESEGACSESDGCGTESHNESQGWSDQSSGDNFDESDECSD
eukprot:GFUD01023391.1.p1 GENE.GFUD01023391.1~~GFUD01023391.1.p1  ORF type:complete len:311 (+),score=101.03 GFUD01023391.1:57-989(+)